MASPVLWHKQLPARKGTQGLGTPEGASELQEGRNAGFLPPPVGGVPDTRKQMDKGMLFCTKDKIKPTFPVTFLIYHQKLFLFFWIL